MRKNTFVAVLVIVVFISGCVSPAPPSQEPSAPEIPAAAPEPTPTPAPIPIAEPVPVPSPPPTPTPELIPPSEPSSEAQVYFGLFTYRSMDEIEELIGKKPSILQFGIAWEEEYNGFPTEDMENARSNGAIPEITWSPSGFSTDPDAETWNQPKFQLRKIIRGDFDEYIRQFARDAKEWGHPFFLRFAHEMNGDWYPWSETVNGNSRGEYIQMWRHVHDVFEEECPNCATWVWAPDAGGQSYTPPVDFTELYPGDEYVDWVGLSAYNVEVARYPEEPWEEFEDSVEPSYEKLQTIAPEKPIFISETGVVEEGGNKAQWIQNVLPALKTKFPKIKTYSYFDIYREDFPDTQIDTSDESREAFREMVSDPYFASNEFGSLDISPIPPIENVSTEESRMAGREIAGYMKGVEIEVSLEEMQEMRSAGITGITTEWGMEEDVARARAFLDRAHTADLKVVMDGGFSEAAWGYDYDEGFSEDQLPVWQEDLVEEWVYALKDHPALFTWDISSEDGENFPNGAGSSLWPEKSSLTIEQLKTASATVRAVDPQHPILLRMHYWDPSPNPFGAGNWFADGIADIVMINLYSNYAEDHKTPNLPDMVREHGQRHIDEVRLVDPDATIWIAVAAFEAETGGGYFLRPTASDLRRDIKAVKALSGISGIGFLEWGPNVWTAPFWYLPRDGEDLWQAIQEEIRSNESAG